MKGAAFVFGDEINTDYIAPAGFSEDNLVENLMKPIRPGFHEEIVDGDIIVAGDHFGSGSSRETAPKAVQEAGIAAVVAESFSRLYYRNSVNIGLPALTVPDATEHFSEGDTVSISMADGTVKNETTGETVDSEPISPELRRIYDAGGLFGYYHEQQEAEADE
ncbi:3-isopropylmalate dehydratase [Halobellus salinisoli]|uniref:LeuD/DmdB family oxidoreductase small subunit n=1 Tax=Halobellus salinisoli TaxID=3108500 RepID=UPI00300884BF